MRPWLLLVLFGVLFGSRLSAQPAPNAAPQSADANRENSEEAPRRRPEGFGRPIELGPDDKQTFPDPPDSITQVREGVDPGRLEMIETSRGRSVRRET
jgi:hypothetical protein